MAKKKKLESKKIASPNKKVVPKSIVAKKPLAKRGGDKKATTKTQLGPVTLAEARALAIPTATKGTRRTVTLAAVSELDSAPPKKVADARRELDKQRDEVIKNRIKEYNATMKILMQRGVKGPKTSAVTGTVKGQGATLASISQPLRVLAEGDSWFDYPVPFFGGGLIPRLQSLLGVPILNLASAGDEVRNMLGVAERAKLTAKLKGGLNEPPWDVLLFSGGGNDIVGNPMVLWIKDYDATVSPEKLINDKRFASALDLVRAGYEDLIALRDELSPATQILFHGYDFAFPDGRGVCGFGPWLKPTFDARGFPNLDETFKVVKAMLLQFAAMLTSIQSAHAGVTFINTQATLAPQLNSWDNELHPSSASFQKLAKVFQQELKKLFPSRVF